MVDYELTDELGTVGPCDFDGTHRRFAIHGVIRTGERCTRCPTVRPQFCAR